MAIGGLQAKAYTNAFRTLFVFSMMGLFYMYLHCIGTVCHRHARLFEWIHSTLILLQTMCLLLRKTWVNNHRETPYFVLYSRGGTLFLLSWTWDYFPVVPCIKRMQPITSPWPGINGDVHRQLQKRRISSTNHIHDWNLFVRTDAVCTDRCLVRTLRSGGYAGALYA